jgi:uncharacterized protein YuzE
MQIAYDREADALYIRLLAGEFQCRVVRLTDDIALDFAEGERLVGIEVLGASRLFAIGRRFWVGSGACRPLTSPPA